MNSLSRILPVLTCLLLAAAPAVRAADTTTSAPATEPARPHQKQMREQRLKQLDDKLHLTAEQKARIVEIWDKAGADTRAMRHEDKAKAAASREQRRELQRATRDQVRAVLTPEQQKVFDEMPRMNGAKPAAPAPSESR